MTLHPMAGHPAKPEILIDPARLGKTMVSSGLIDRVVHQLGHRLLEIRSALNGLCPGSSTEAAASVARRAPGRASCAAMARLGPRTKMAWFSASWQQRSPPLLGGIPVNICVSFAQSSAIRITRVLIRRFGQSRGRALRKSTLMRLGHRSWRGNG
jgi:hypothetical protein